MKNTKHLRADENFDQINHDHEDVYQQDAAKREAEYDKALNAYIRKRTAAQKRARTRT